MHACFKQLANKIETLINKYLEFDIKISITVKRKQNSKETHRVRTGASQISSSKVDCE
jgi:hypothetical protein